MILLNNRDFQKTLLNIEQFCLHYGDDNRYELIDGELIDLEPTGIHEEIAAFITLKLCTQIDKANFPWFILQRGLLRPSSTTMTAFRPDVMVVDRPALIEETLWPEQSILTLGSSIRLIAEVVSGNWQNDYARKVEDYATLGIPEYWIVDHSGLGGTRYIGRPKQPTLTICQLVDGDYQMQLLRGDDPIISSQFPDLNLTAGQVLAYGQ
ncbi:Uma2 family endonuclease [Synechocystis sp. FACHB-383]|uniref:Uma2 family endonuclease n=1 Tax=Synechocystis sp. FACHB-383 TaxID=2692864 RepID=UPI001689F060|nr:Uma2 family endonuclease [Synechocystis sp. FACHB-383]MBD2653528.1 Uma2 family endonuclease [Synechocystis sp. FACHB-383]